MNPLKSFSFLMTVLMALSFSACDDDDDDNNQPKSNSLKVNFQHQVDGDSLVFDTLKYRNKAGEAYGVTKLEYIITDFRLYKGDGNFETITTAQYINPQQSATTSFTLKDLPKDQFQQVSFVFGIRESRNKSGNLPQESNFANMGWPPNNGGGYHYMRMNGIHDSAGSRDGFTTHLGHTKKWNLDSMPPTLMEDQVKSYAFEVKLDVGNLTLEDNQAEMTVIMDLNNWYQNPNTYKFTPMKMEGIMKNQQKQQALMENGKKDVFRLGDVQD